YHRPKHERGFARAIDVLGADHHGYIGRMRAAMQALGYPADFYHVELVELVRVVRGGEEVRFSERSGEFVTLRDLFQETGEGAARRGHGWYRKDGVLGEPEEAARLGLAAAVRHVRASGLTLLGISAADRM